MSELHQLVVVGAGAAGLWAAARAAELGVTDVVVLEKTARSGTKILASGGTHCNVTTTLPPEDAARLFGDKGARFLRTAFRELPPLALRERFHDLGVPTVDAPLEKVFPASGKAKDVRDALERWAIEGGVGFEFDFNVATIERDGAWQVRSTDGRTVRASELMLCAGGKSYSGSGTTGDGYAWLEQLDLKLVPTVPALVPLCSEESWVHELSGLAIQDAEIRLEGLKAPSLTRRRRPVLFTHQGLSGPAAMDVSEAVARAEHLPVKAAIDLLPNQSREDLRDALLDAAAAKGQPRLGRLLRNVPRRLLAQVTLMAGLSEANPPVAQIAKSERHQLIETLKGLTVPISGELGYDKAEVTAGGLHLKEVDPGTMRVRRAEGLYVFGELLDLQGPIGGLNFQAAWSEAELAGRAAAAK